MTLQGSAGGGSERSRLGAIRAAIAELSRDRTPAEQQWILNSRKALAPIPGNHPGSTTDLAGTGDHQALMPGRKAGPATSALGSSAIKARRNAALLHAVNNTMAITEGKGTRSKPQFGARMLRAREEARKVDLALYEDCRTPKTAPPSTSSTEQKRYLPHRVYLLDHEALYLLYEWSSTSYQNHCALSSPSGFALR